MVVNSISQGVGGSSDILFFAFRAGYQVYDICGFTCKGVANIVDCVVLWVGRLEGHGRIEVQLTSYTAWRSAFRDAYLGSTEKRKSGWL